MYRASSGRGVRSPQPVRGATGEQRHQFLMSKYYYIVIFNAMDYTIYRRINCQKYHFEVKFLHSIDEGRYTCQDRRVPMTYGVRCSGDGCRTTIVHRRGSHVVLAIHGNMWRTSSVGGTHLRQS